MKKIISIFCLLLFCTAAYSQIADSLLVTSTKEILKVKGVNYVKTTTVSYTPVEQSEEFKQVESYLSTLNAENKQRQQKYKEIKTYVSLYKDALKKGYKPEPNSNEAMLVREVGKAVSKIDSMDVALKKIK